jgi:hypothetical protein
MMEPINACEELLGSPIAHVPRFQMIAAIQQREDHGVTGAAADLQDQLHRQQGDDREATLRWMSARPEVETSRPDHGHQRRQLWV